MNLCNCLGVVGQKKMMQDPAIKLFGKEIPLSSNDGGGDDVSCSDTSSVEKEDRGEEQEVETEKKKKKKKKLFPAEAAESMQLSNGIDTLPGSVTIQATSIDEKETEKLKSSKIVKKPDKILPCPRCNSKNTKFCYYNNYNPNQPRHFCRSCQRYWTAGGTMRNMPVGAGRRKTKSSSSHCHQITISEALQAAQMDVAANGIHHPGLKYHDGIILKSGGFDPLIHDSRASMLHGTNKKVPNGMTNGFRSPKSGKRCSSNSNGENCDDRSNDSTVSTLSSNNGGTVNMNFHPEIPGIPGIPWTCLWNYPAILPPPTLCPPGFSIPFHPSTSLNCNFLSYLNFPSPVTSNSVPDSPTLGKCARDEEVLHLQNPMKRRKTSVLVPKTLRVDNPTDVAKSTIWSTLGINNDSLCSEGGFFKVRSAGTISPALVSNPAALSRSLNFVESSSA